MADYTLQQAQADIAQLRGMIARLNLIFDQSGQLGYVGKDGNSYNTGTLHTVNTGAQTITSASFTPITNGGALQANVSALPYFFWGIFRTKQGSTANIPGNVGFNGPGSGTTFWYAFSYSQGALTGFNGTLVQGAPLATVNVLGGTAANQENYCWYIGYTVFTSPGLFQAGAISNGTNSFIVQPGCIFNVSPANR